MSKYNKRYRVLLLAEMANPDWPSVPLIGWQNAVYLREVADSHLVTQIRNKAAIERHGWHDGSEFTSIDSEVIERRTHRLGVWLGAKNGKSWTTGTALASISYYYFEYLVWKKFGKKIQAGEFDIVHRVTPVSPTAQSMIASKCAKYGVPMIIGPINGGVKWPKEFDRARHAEREWLSYVRSVYRLMPGYVSTLKNTSCFLIGSKDTLADIPEKYHNKCVYFPENGIDPLKFSHHSDPWRSGPLRAVFIGRLVPYKGADMLLEALAPLILTNKVALDIVGDGPMMQELLSLSIKLGLNKLVIFHGNVEHKEISKLLANSHILTFPSIREFGGGVVLEAMATGVVPVVVDYGGPGDLVNGKIGYKLPLRNRLELIESLREVVTAILNDRSEIKKMADRGRTHIDNKYTWTAKVKNYLDVYDWVVFPNVHRKPQPYEY